MGRPTLRDVAERAGTSTAVVSYVLNSGPRPVAEATRIRVQQAIADLGYRPDSLARAMRARRTETIGLVVPDLGKAFFAELTAAVESAVSAGGRRLLVAASQFSADREMQQVRALVDARVDGVLLAPSENDGSAPSWLASNSVPHVVMHRYVAGAINVVGRDIEAGRMATRHLVEHGHRAIACLTGPSADSPVDRRARGYRDTMGTLDGPAPETWSRTCDYANLNRSAYLETRDLLVHSPEVTAICATTDEYAVGALRAAAELGRRVGDDLALVGIDGTMLSAYLTPALTVLRAPFGEIGAEAVDALLASTDGKQAAGRELDLELIRRRSCGCAHERTEQT
ncbi:MAG: substrate-binding domain-containing protein [Streptosporangiales bacterium]|nr:substrate-binding domain-containing protein [Streptosporangiales bacterium]